MICVANSGNSGEETSFRRIGPNAQLLTRKDTFSNDELCALALHHIARLEPTIELFTVRERAESRIGNILS